jgi:hypothetical protein
MSKYGLKYHIALQNAEKDENEELVGTLVYLDIYDRSLVVDDAATVLQIDVAGHDSVVKIATVDNNEDKFTPIKALQATIEFLSDGSVSASTFAEAPIPSGGTDPGDPRWYVEIYLNDTANSIFKGFLNLSDCSEPFLPHPNVVTLTASDGLGTLKDKELKTFEDATPRGYYRIADYISWCLRKTGQQLPLNVVYNIREANHPDSHLFDVMYLWSKTFEEEIGTCEDCYSVLEKILGEGAFLTQRGGEWWIVRVDDLGDETDTYITTFNSDGTVNTTTIEAYQKTIGYAEAIFFSGEATNVTTTRPYKFVRETYRFEFPREIIDNIDFSRSETTYFSEETFIDPLDGLEKIRRKYTLEDWRLLQNSSGVQSDTQAYVERIFEGQTDQEKERYVVIEHTAAGGYYYIQSNPIPVQARDKFNLSVDARYKADLTASSGEYTHFTIQVRLYADDGTYWTLDTTVNQPAPPHPPIKPVWKQTNAAFTTNNGYVYQYGYNSDDLSQWTSSSVEATPIPKDGRLVIQLLHTHDSSEQDRHFSNLSFEYIPYINGSYQKYSALSYKALRSTDFQAKRQEDVKLSDGLKKLFKGALLGFNKQLLFQATASFGSFGSAGLITFLGANVTTYFSSGDTISVRGTTLNNRLFNVVSVFFNGSDSAVVTREVPTAESSVFATFERASAYLASEFFNYQKVQSPTDGDIHSFQWFQTFDVWNQYRNVTRRLEATCQGLTSSQVDSNGKADLPHLIYRYTLTDQSNHTSLKTFMLLTFEWDMYTCEWTGTLAEVYNQGVGKFYQDTLEIKYTQ